MSVVKQVLDIRRYQQYIKPHQQRIKADAGSLVRDDRAKEFFDVLKQIGIYDSCKLAISPDFGIKTRVSGSNTFVSKGYSLVQNNDATQTTSTSQPHLGNIIAPNERPSFKNQNYQSNYLTHPTISFAANEAWTISVIVNFYGTTKLVAGCMICGDAVSKYIVIYKSGFISISNGIGVYNFNTKVDFGKSTILHFISNGTLISLYINGVFRYSISVNTQFSSNKILDGWSDTEWLFEGSISLYTIFNRAITPTQVAQLSNYLMAKYPEIPSVTIGSQVWATSNCEMVATPMGNLIANVTANANVERITNAADREFSSDTGFWTKVNGVTISSGKAIIDTVVSAIFYRAGLISPVPKWYKVTFTVLDYIQGSISPDGFSYSSIMNVNANGIYVAYCLSSGYKSPGFISEYNSKLSIDNVSIEEIGWAGSTELYNAIYAATSGTDEQKTYAAVKAAAMWCYYNNDASLGAIYGKLYNWYAVKLLQMDIDYYNAANPSTPWGWRVPTDTDFNTLATTLGGASVAGGKMKKEGLVYWSSPNTGADNSSGFSAISSGRRIEDGTSQVVGSLTYFYVINIVGGIKTLNYAAITLNTGSTLPARGMSLRLIKS